MAFIPKSGTNQGSSCPIAALVGPAENPAKKPGKWENGRADFIGIRC